MDEYLNAKAMLAPGVAGTTTTMITGTLASLFGLPGSYTALVVSFVLGMMVFSDSGVSLPQRVLLYVVNSMIIFTVSIGLNTAGVAAMKTDQPPVQERRVEPEAAGKVHRPFFHPWF